MPYSFKFSSNEPYRYRTGGLFFGVDPKRGFEVGIETERHAITVAGARSGKGAALMIPNLLQWPHNALVIDPKGEAAENTAEARERMGQAVHVLDPFNELKPPALQRFKARFNPLDSISRDQLDARESVGVLSDGLLLRHDPRAGHWDGGSLSVLSGLIAYVLDTAPPEKRNLPEVRRIITDSAEAFGVVVKAMSTNGSFGNLPAAGAAKLMKTGSEAGHFVSGADENTKWLDSPAVGAVLSSSTFDLSDLKTKPCTVYLVLPAHLLGEHGRFLRLFVRMALNAMAKGGTRGRRCLFMLDEFYSLGHIDEIAKAAGLMPGYGVHLWPILQDLGQLESLYGRDGMHTFFGNADAHIFFGNTDGLTLDYVSQRLGQLTIEEIRDAPVNYAGPPPTGQTAARLLAGNNKHSQQSAAMIGGAVGLLGGALHHLGQVAAQHDMNDYRKELNKVGRPRIPADEIRELVGKKTGDVVARSMIVFAQGRDVLQVKLAPYFEQKAEQPVPVKKPLGRRYGPLDLLGGVIAILLLGSVAGPLSDPSVPRETWPTIYALWAVLSVTLVGVVVWKHKTRH